MQQTTTYKLNKPESTDTFSVSPLNENADTLEDQLARLDGADAAETAARTAETAALDQRVTALEVHKIAAGTYEGKGSEQIIELGFTPAAVLVSKYVDNWTGLAVTGYQYGYEGYMLVAVAENGFKLGRASTGGINFNQSGTRYHYVAFG